MATKKNYQSFSGTIKHLSIVFLGTFFLGISMSLSTNAVMEGIDTILPSVILLMVIVAINVIFDVVGVAVAVANISPFNARAARKAAGANISIKLIRKSSLVSNICCDVLGDVCGIISGAIGASIAITLSSVYGGLVFYTTIVAGLIGAFTVGGKALGKISAINQAEQIMMIIGQILDIDYWKQIITGSKYGKEVQ